MKFNLKILPFFLGKIVFPPSILRFNPIIDVANSLAKIDVKSQYYPLVSYEGELKLRC